MVEITQEYEEEQKKIDIEAEKLGIKGLYRKLLLLESRHKRAIEYLIFGRTEKAYDALNGYDE